MSHLFLLRAIALYLPIALTLLAVLLAKPQRRTFAACLLSFLWVLPALNILQRLNIEAHWWSFAHTEVALLGMPLELFLGWSILWGLLPQIALRRLPVVWPTVAMVAVDLIAMPRLRPLVILGPKWLVGESVAAAFVLLPAICIASWTLTRTRLWFRATLQIVIAILLLLDFIPEIALVPGFQGPYYAWYPLLSRSSWQGPLLVQLLFLLALPGLAAVMEFAQRGGGTPIPYDPPIRLVTSGIYRFCANPMQLSCTLVMLIWAVILGNAWLLAAAGIAVAYSAGIAEWDEQIDLAARFGQPWRDYRRQVRAWRPRWRPYHAGLPAHVYIAGSCGICTELRRWIEARRPIGLEIMDAETLPAGSIQRIRYIPADDVEFPGRVEGIRAAGRVFEHLNLAWALCGAAIRLPGIWQFLQLLMDASGLGPRQLSANPSSRTT